jgi:hypothetical protein
MVNSSGVLNPNPLPFQQGIFGNINRKLNPKMPQADSAIRLISFLMNLRNPPNPQKMPAFVKLAFFYLLPLLSQVMV